MRDIGDMEKVYHAAELLNDFCSETEIGRAHV